ncbi:unnamed protein product [Camellia sinensis]
MNDIIENQIQAIRTDFQSRIEVLESQLQAEGVPIVVDSLSSHPTIRPMPHQQQSYIFSS